MKTVVSLLLLIALIILFAYSVLPRAPYTSARIVKKQGRFLIEATSSQPALKGLDAAWKKNKR